MEKKQAAGWPCHAQKKQDHRWPCLTGKVHGRCFCVKQNFYGPDQP